MKALNQVGSVRRTSSILETAPLGPSSRRFANAVALISCQLDPAKLLCELKAIEHTFGRRRGRRWGERVLDLDIIFWSVGAYGSRRLTIPHPAYRERLFVLRPAAQIVPDWRDPITGLSVRHLCARLTQPKPLDRTPRAL